MPGGMAVEKLVHQILGVITPFQHCRRLEPAAVQDFVNDQGADALPRNPVFDGLELRITGYEPLQAAVTLKFLGQIKGPKAPHERESHLHLNAEPRSLTNNFMMVKVACHSPCRAASCSTA